MKTYEGRREGPVALVTVNGQTLNPRLDLRNHSPTGFEWGYGGSGPAQLALAIVSDHVGDDSVATELYQQFKWAVVANLPASRWRLNTEGIKVVLSGLAS
jgi:hypothetical protein